MKELVVLFLIIAGWLTSIMVCVWTERDVTSYYFGQSRFEVAEKVKQCEVDLARNQRCKVKVVVEKP